MVEQARNVFAGSDAADTELMAAAREAGWALMEIVDGIDWTKRNQVSAIIERLGKTLAATRPAEAQAVAEGWKLVPVDPTEAMCVAGCREDDILGELVDWRGPDTTTREVVANLYRTMLAASPATGGA